MWSADERLRIEQQYANGTSAVIYHHMYEQIVLAPRTSQLDESQVSVQESLLESHTQKRAKIYQRQNKLDLAWIWPGIALMLIFLHDKPRIFSLFHYSHI